MCRAAKRMRVCATCLFMLFASAMAVQLTVDGPPAKKKKAPKASPPCPPKDNLEAITKYGGSGGNAYVLIMTKESESKCLQEGEVLKVYAQTRENADVIGNLFELKDKLLDDSKQFATSTMASVVKQCGIASVPLQCKDDSDRCLFTGDCANVPENFAQAMEQGRCKYMVFESAGSKTLEKCVRELTDKTALKSFVVGAIDKLVCLHSALVYHQDFQWKNLMTNADCDPEAIKIVDVDDITKIRSTKEKADWKQQKKALKDVLDLLGQNLEEGTDFQKENPELQSSSFTLESWVSTPGSELEKNIEGKVKDPNMNADGQKFARMLDETIKAELKEFLAMREKKLELKTEFEFWKEITTWENNLIETIKNME